MRNLLELDSFILSQIVSMMTFDYSKKKTIEGTRKKVKLLCVEINSELYDVDDIEIIPISIDILKNFSNAQLCLKKQNNITCKIKVSFNELHSNMLMRGDCIYRKINNLDKMKEIEYKEQLSIERKGDFDRIVNNIVFSPKYGLGVVKERATSRYYDGDYVTEYGYNVEFEFERDGAKVFNEFPFRGQRLFIVKG